MDSKKNSNRRKPVHSPSPKVVGLARNTFGTRLCQRVVCAKCQKIDHVSVRVSAAKDTFCRNCAEKILATYDQGRKIAEKKTNQVCEQCNRIFMVEETIAMKKDYLLCIDCLRGFDVWRGKIAESPSTQERKKTILTKVGSKTTFRKTSHDAI